MLVSIAEYAKKIQKNISVVRKHCTAGKFKTAKKIGKNWVIDINEPYIESAKEWKKREN